MVSTDDYWNTIPLFTLFREAIEASIIVSVLISFVRRMNAKHLEKQVWWGVGSACLVSIGFGIIFIVIFYEASENLFQGTNQMYFKAAVSFVASIMISYLAFAMLRFMGWEAKWERRLTEMAKKKTEAEAHAKGSQETAAMEAANQVIAIDTNPSPPDSVDGEVWYQPKTWRTDTWWPRFVARLQRVNKPIEPAAVTVDDSDLKWTTRNAFFIAVFLTVVREGLESVVFLAGVGNAKPTAIVLPGVIGLICGCLVGVVLYYTGKTIKDIKWLFVTMAAVLFFIAAGQMELGFGWLMTAGGFGTYYSGPLVAEGSLVPMAFGDGDEFYDAGGGDDDGYAGLDLRPWWMRPLWDITSCCDDKNEFWALLKAIFGYNPNPCFVEVMAYCGYWIVVICIACIKFHKGTLFDADYKHNQMVRKAAMERSRAAAQEAAAAAAKGIDGTKSTAAIGRDNSEEEAAKNPAN